MKKNIPNALTLTNLLFGFSACVFAIKGMIEIASVLIIAGMIFDFFDGFAARLLKAYSDIGKELDSLADVVSFGVAPGLIVFSLLSGTNITLIPAIIISGLIPMASALRLAKFNNDPEQKTYFKGIPTPASALLIVALVTSGLFGGFHFVHVIIHNPVFLISLSVFLSIMMLINVRMISLKFSNLKFKGNEERFIFLGVSAIALIIFRLNALVIIMAAYIIISFIAAIIRSK